MGYMGFDKLSASLSDKGAKNPGALAAYIGRKKYGKKKFQAAANSGDKMSSLMGSLKGSK